MVKESFFHGQRDYRVDAKGRIPFPPHWLPQMELHRGESLIVAKGMSQTEHYLEVFSPEAWSGQVAKIRESLPEGELKSRFVRWYVSTAESVEPDSQNRIRLPKNLMEWAGIKKDISLLGAVETIQLWSKESMSDSGQFDPEELGSVFELFNIKKNPQESE
ncbi:hypothetical protein KAH37_02705 [bacterium]|nr:hypothetical protein [bacterium]